MRSSHLAPPGASPAGTASQGISSEFPTVASTDTTGTQIQEQSGSARRRRRAEVSDAAQPSGGRGSGLVSQMRRSGSTTVMRCYSGSWADFDAIPDEDGDDTPPESGAASDSGSAMSPEVRNRSIVGLRGDSPIRDEEGRVLTLPPPPRPTEMARNFSGSCLDLQALDETPQRSPRGDLFSAIPAGLLARREKVAVPKATGILDFVGAQNALSHRYGLKRGDSKTVTVVYAGTFVASHCIVQLLQQGYLVHAVLTAATPDAGPYLMQAADGAAGELHLSECDLLGSNGTCGRLAAALRESSGLVICPPQPVTEATVHEVRAVFSAVREHAPQIDRCVFTSSARALRGPHEPAPNAALDSASTPTDSTLEIRIETEVRDAAADMDVEIVCIVPAAPIGPLVTPELPPGLQLLVQLCTGRAAERPGAEWVLSDVRDVAAAHLLALQQDRVGTRYLVACGGAPVTPALVATIMADRFPHLAQLPRSRSDCGELLQQLGSEYRMNTRRTRRELHLRPTGASQSILDAVEELVDVGHLPDAAEAASMKQRQRRYPLIGIAVAAACIGCAVGLWMAGSYSRSRRQR